MCIPLDQEGNTFYSVFCRVNKVNGQNTDTPEERRKTVEETPEEYELAQQELTDLQERRKTEQVTQEQYELVQETTDSSDSRKIELAQDETTNSTEQKKLGIFGKALKSFQSWIKSDEFDYLTVKNMHQLINDLQTVAICKYILHKIIV